MAWRFLLVRVLRALITLWAVVSLVFLVLRVTGDPVTALVPDTATPEVIAAYRAKFGLDRSLAEQYFAYGAAILEGDLGRSFIDRRPAFTVLMERVPNTLLLSGTALAIAIVLGLLAGIAAAFRRDSLFDRMVMTFAVAGFSLPTFFLGILGILFFAVELRWLPSSGSATLWHLVLPAMTLGLHGAAVLARFTRSAMVEVLGEPYIRAARAKGLADIAVLTRHALPNAAIPILTVLGMMLGHLVGGSLIVETVFAWPGVGRLMVTAVAQRDLAVVQAAVLLIAFSMTAANLLVDLAYAWLNPRLSVRGKAMAS